MQHNWIGRSEGAELRFALAGSDGGEITVFTTRPDTLYGASFIALSPQHPLATKLADVNQGLRNLLLNVTGLVRLKR